MEQEIQMQTEPIIYTAGGGAVDSVNGYTGVVVLTTSDLENTSDYQTGSEVESAITTAIAGKQNTLTAGSNITIQNDTISATDTTYTAGYGLGLSGTEFAVNNAVIATQDNVTNLQGQIDALAAASDVTDIVGTYAELQAYDTAHLKDNDIIKVLQDETHDGETTYYRWSTATQTFTLIGEEGPYYTKAATDILLAGKQDTLTAGANITIASDNTISATDTTYSNFVGTDGTAAGTAGLVPAPATTDAGKFLKADGTWDTAGGGSAVTVLTSADYDYPANDPAGVALWKLTPGLYSWGENTRVYWQSGSTVTTPGVAQVWPSNSGFTQIMIITNTYGYVTKVYSSNGSVASTLYPQYLITPVVQTTGTSTTSVMSQDAVTSTLYGQLNTRLDGLTLLKISQTDYDNLPSYDANTLYVITGA